MRRPMMALAMLTAMAAARAQSQPAHRADARRAAALNKAARTRAVHTAFENLSPADAHRQSDDYRAALAEHDAGLVEVDAARVNDGRRLRAYDDAMARWCAKVVADRPVAP